MSRIRGIFLFLLASLLVSAAVFWPAMTGKHLLAPVDLGPENFRHYGFVDPSASGIPDNHYVVDQFTYDLPLQHLIYESYRSGEMPWWDPYTFGGRPLLADAHINGTDPIRLLCYRLLPFELAYNWNIILRGIATGLGIFLLLRFLEINLPIAALLALAYQFCGAFALFFGHPWIQGSFVYYPLIWIAWCWAGEGRLRSSIILGGLSTALIFYAGNLQSHTYLVVISFCFSVAVLITDRTRFFRYLTAIALSGLIGGALAAPVLANQLEFYFNSFRAISAHDPAWMFPMRMLLESGSFYPWMFGTFKTLDIGRLARASGISFLLFAGTVVSFLALYGLSRNTLTKPQRPHVRITALLLICCYFLIIGTPLNDVFYSRSAPLAVMSVIVLAGFGAMALVRGERPRRLMLYLAAGVLLTVSISSSLMAWFVYPRLKDRIEQRVFSSIAKNDGTTGTAKLRQKQLETLPREISLRNPEALVSVAAALVLIFFLLRQRQLSPRTATGVLSASLGVSLITVVMFYARFRPSHDVALWHRLKQGGETQRMIAEKVGAHRRFFESASPAEKVFPNAMSALYRVRVVHGYSALQPRSMYSTAGITPLPFEETADEIWSNEGGLKTLTPPGGTIRFQALPGGQAEILHETLNTIQLRVTGAERVKRLETLYPGWTAISEGVRLPQETPSPFAGEIIIPRDGKTHEITLVYRPTYLSPAIRLAAITLAALLILGATLLKWPEHTMRAT